jgi:hypothetical protein
MRLEGQGDEPGVQIWGIKWNTIRYPNNRNCTRKLEAKAKDSIKKAARDHVNVLVRNQRDGRM